MKNNIYKFFTTPIVYILGAIFLVEFFANVYWATQNSIDPHQDMGRHLWNSLYYLNNLHKPLFIYLHTLWTEPYKYYPPFVYIITTFVYILTRRQGEVVAVLSLTPFLANLIIFTYIYARRYLNSKASIVAVIFISTTPIVFTLFHEYMIDVPLLSVFVTSLYLLEKNNNFKSLPYSALFGISFGVGMMTKWTYLFAIIAPMLWIIPTLLKSTLQELKEKNYRSTVQRIINILIALLLIWLILGDWYTNNLGALRHDLLDNAISGKSDNLSFGVDWMMFYLMRLENNIFYIFYFLFFTAGFVYSTFINKELRSKLWKILFSFFVSYILITLINNKDVRYIIPLLIFPSIYAASLFENIKSRALFNISFIAFTCFAIMQTYFVSFYSTTDPIKISLPLSQYSSNPTVKGQRMYDLVLLTNYGYTSGAPVKDNWPVLGIMNDVVKFGNKIQPKGIYEYTDTKTKDKFEYTQPYYANFLYFSGDDRRSFNAWDLRYYSTKLSSPFEFNEGETNFNDGGILIVHYDNDTTNKEVINSIKGMYKIEKIYTMPDKTKAYLVYITDNNNLSVNQCESINDTSFQCRLK